MSSVRSAEHVRGLGFDGRPRAGRTRHQRRHAFGFRVVTLAFLVNMGFSAVPTPLYVLYQQHYHFSTIMITVVYAAYAVGVIGGLFFGGHVSDWIGRKKVLLAALLVDAISGLIFLSEPGLAGLLFARVVCGVSIGLTTATATAYLGELYLGTRTGETGSPHRAQIVATAANLGGIGVGPLVAGLLAEYAPHPLRLPYVVFVVALLALALLVALSPETVKVPVPGPRYRPQRIAVPRHARRLFFAATATGFAAFSVYGVFNSLVPTFLAGTLHEHSHALAGGVAFVAFAAGAIAQIAAGQEDLRRTLRLGPQLLIPGLATLTAGMWIPNLATFVIGGLLTGAGAGLSFRSALTAAGSTAPPESRAEVLAGYFLGTYVGLSLPVVGLGVATQCMSARSVMLIFMVIVAVAMLFSTRRVLAEFAPRYTPQRNRSTLR
ncbi:MFS transporter [Streptomyces sp. NPDC059875]|uniref:MFS transporter n=1 Tax=unclassified Streptomyces TaxID=2593676 RepID=UPI00365A7644